MTDAAVPVTCAVRGCEAKDSMRVGLDGGLIWPPKDWGIGPADYRTPLGCQALYCPEHLPEQLHRLGLTPDRYVRSEDR